VARIYFTKDIPGLLQREFGGDLGGDTIVVHHAMYDEPKVKAGKVLEWEKYKVLYGDLEPAKIVLVGVNRMITPSNRCDFIHAYLTVMTPQTPKIVIDTAPFIGEPWRLYYHYQIANCFQAFGANYSYPIEGEWRRWFERKMEECQFSPAVLKSRIVETWSDLPRLDTTFSLHEVDAKDREWYEEAKRFELDRYKAPKSLLSGLLKAADTHFGLDVSFDSYLTGRAFDLPDVGIYRFVVEENRRRMGIYNLFTAGL